MAMVFFLKRCHTDVFWHMLPWPLIRLFGPIHRWRSFLAFWFSIFLVGFYSWYCNPAMNAIWLVSGERLTSLEISLVRCFAFYKTSLKTLGTVFFKNIVQNIASLSKKCNVFTRCFRSQKVHPGTEIDKHGKLSVENIRPRRPHIQVKECALSPVCHLVFLQLMCLCVLVQSHWLNL